MNWCPKFIRADKGQESVLLADAYLRLFLDTYFADRVIEEELDTLSFSDYFFFSASTGN